ncbi:MAG: HlyC/CorC family transporter [Planctomycetes bacterium]|nr:HlyC/CorC family transporter [Planctomycetota bacterium]
MLPVVIFILLLLAFWSALGCDSLRDFSYSRLEELCEANGVPDRFGKVLKEQGAALLVLEFVLTSVTLALSGIICVWIGWPIVADGQMTQRIGWTFILQYATFALLTFFFADVLPWTIARVAAERFLYRWWPVIELLQTLLKPGLWIANQLDRYAHRIAGRAKPDEDDASVLEQDIRSVVEEGEREGVLQQGSTVMIQRVMELQDEDVGAIMTPRTDMHCVPADCTLEEARKILIESGHSRMPVIGDSTDDVLGILYAKDLLKALEPHRTGEPIAVLRDIIRDPVYVPLTIRIPAMLELMKRQKIHIAMVHDEYGGVAGLVTMEDILEEIVGEIADEYDEEQAGDEIQTEAGVVEIEARVRLDEINRQFDFDLPETDDFDTVGGFVFSQFGRIPTVGETLDWNQLRFTVLEADTRRIQRLRIEQLDGVALALKPPAE